MESVLAILIGSVIGTTFYLWCGHVLKKKSKQNFVRDHAILHPNSICYIRTILAWIGFYYYFHAHWHGLGIIVFTFAAILDGVDGLVARKCDLITHTGESLDPLCDKLTYLPPLIQFAQNGLLHLWPIWIFVMIEIFGQFFARSLLTKINASISANNFGKIKTVICFVLVIYCALWSALPSLPKMCDEILIGCIMLGISSIFFKFIKRDQYAMIFALFNVLCVVAGCIFAIKGHLAFATTAVITGQMFDLLDGYAARKLGNNKDSQRIDFYADMIGFCVCGAIMLFTRDALLIGILYCIISGHLIIRKKDDMPQRTTVGLPSLSGALGIFGSCLIMPPSWLTYVVLMIMAMMLSPIKFTHFGFAMIKRVPKPVLFVGSACIMVLLAYVIKTQNVFLFGSLLLCVIIFYAIISIYMSYTRTNDGPQKMISHKSS